MSRYKKYIPYYIILMVIFILLPLPWKLGLISETIAVEFMSTTLILYQPVVSAGVGGFVGYRHGFKANILLVTLILSMTANIFYLKDISAALLYGGVNVMMVVIGLLFGLSISKLFSKRDAKEGY